MQFRINLVYWAIPLSLGFATEDDGVYFVARLLCFTLKWDIDYED